MSGRSAARWRDGVPMALAVVVAHAAAITAAVHGLAAPRPEPLITPPSITGVLVAEASQKLVEAAPTREPDPEIIPEPLPPPPEPPPPPPPEPPPPPPPEPPPPPPPEPPPPEPPPPPPKPKPKPKPKPLPPVKAPPTERSVSVPEEPVPEPVAREPEPVVPVESPLPVAAAPPAPPAAPERREAAAAPPVAPPISDAAHLRNPAPVYPTRSRRLGEEGRVVLELLILADGRVGEIKVKRSSGFAALDQSALDAVRRWNFVPARRGDEPIPYRYELPVVFSLRS